jgi:thiol-disulfide isomerase/thioredoxin
MAADKKTNKSKSPVAIQDDEQIFKYSQFLGVILVIGFIIIGTAAGSYSLLNKLNEAPCLGCLGLYPSFEIEFTFNTADGSEHPDWVRESLNEGPILIEFTQNDISCPPCARMRPKIDELIDEYQEKVKFYIINVIENEVFEAFQNIEKTKSIIDSEETRVYNIYDVENVGKGRPATPTYVIITLEKDHDGEVKPFFGVGYGEFKEGDAQKTKIELANVLDFAIERYEFYEGYYSSR